MAGGMTVEVQPDHFGDFREKLVPMTLRRVRGSCRIDAANGLPARIDVIELVNHRVQLGNPTVVGAAIEPLLAGSLQGLIEESRQGE